MSPRALTLFAAAALIVSEVGASMAQASQETTVLRPTAIRDQAMGIERSHTMLVPEGWAVRGGAVWTPAETAISHLELDLTAPVDVGGMGVAFHRSRSATVMESNMPLQGNDAPATRLKAHSTVRDVAVQEILRRKRPGARRIRVIESGTVEPMLKIYDGLFGAAARQMERQGSSSMGGEQYSTKVRLDVPRVRVSYREGGESWEEEMLFYLMKVETANESSFGSWYRTTVWNVTSPVSVRAKKGDFEHARPLLCSVLGSVKPTEEWAQRRHLMNVAVGRARHRAAMASLEALRRSAEQIARSDRQVREQAADSWRRQQATNDKSQRALADTFAGVERFRLPDGSTMALDAGYKRAYTDGDGAFLLTDDVLTDPNVGFGVEWKRISAVR